MSEQNSGRSFTIFSNLSKELQLKVWESAAPSGRTITITSSDITTQDEDGNTTTTYHVTHNAPQVPSLLRACRESREIALRQYDLAFGAQFSGRRIYFNFDRDILFFRDCHALKSWFGNRNPILGDFTEDEKKLKVIAVGGNPGTEFDIATWNLLNGIWWLEKLILQEPEEDRRTETKSLLQRTWKSCKMFGEEGSVGEVVFKTEREIRELADRL
jgi:2EXR family